MADELINIVDEKGEPTTDTVMKSEAHKNGILHRSSHIWVYNSSGEVLLQLRAKEKDIYPDTWDTSVAGHVGLGENPHISALREVEEEIGLSVDDKKLELWQVRPEKKGYKELTENEIVSIYLVKYDGDVDELTIQEDEVQTIQFFPVDEVVEGLRSDGNYAPHNYWFEILNEIKSRTKWKTVDPNDTQQSI